MTELTTIARPYAEAVFRVACESNAVTSFDDALQGLAQLLASAEVQALIANPNVSDAQTLDVLAQLAAKQAGATLSPALQNFLAVLAENNRLLALPQIAQQFSALRHSHEGTAKAQIISAFPLAGAPLADLLSALEKKFGVKLQAEVEVDPALIGGVRVLVGDRELDTSVRARLTQMAVALSA